MARLAIACTDEMLYARSLAAFWHIHKAISEALERHKNGAGEVLSTLVNMTSVC